MITIFVMSLDNEAEGVMQATEEIRGQWRTVGEGRIMIKNINKNPL